MRDAVLVTIAEPIGAGGPSSSTPTRRWPTTGYDVDDLLGRSPRIPQGPGTDRAETDRVHASLQGGSRSPSSCSTTRKKDGSEFWVEIDIVPLADPNGWFTTGSRCSASSPAQTRRRGEGRRRVFVSDLDSFPAQTAMLDLRGRIVAVNQPWRDFWITQRRRRLRPDWSAVATSGAAGQPGPRRGPGRDGRPRGVRRHPRRAHASERTFTLDYVLRSAASCTGFTLARPPRASAASSGVVVSHAEHHRAPQRQSLMTTRPCGSLAVADRRLLH